MPVLILFIWAAGSNAQPVVYFEEPENDLGTITQKGDRVEHVFEFENKGDQDLVIEGLVPS